MEESPSTFSSKDKDGNRRNDSRKSKKNTPSGRRHSHHATPSSRNNPERSLPPSNSVRTRGFLLDSVQQPISKSGHSAQNSPRATVQENDTVRPSDNRRTQTPTLRHENKILEEVELPADSPKKWSISSYSRQRAISEVQAGSQNDDQAKSTTNSSVRSSVSWEPFEPISPTEIPLKLDEIREKLQDIDDKVLIDQVQRHMLNTEDRLGRAVASLMSIQDADTDKRSDDYFKKSVQTLRYRIKYWSILQKQSSGHRKPRGIFSSSFNFANRAPRSSTKDRSTLLETLTPKYGENYASQEQLSVLVQAYIWAFLVSKVFGFRSWTQSEQYEEIGQLKKAYADFANKLKQGLDRNIPKLEQFHQWRVTSARLMNCQISRRGVAEAASQLAKEVNDDLGLAKGVENSGLSDIMQQALELDADFTRQKAYFHFELVSHNAYFDPNLMNDERGGKVDGGYRKVDLLLAPPLYKQGDSEGENYQAERLVVMKAEVICR